MAFTVVLSAYFAVVLAAGITLSIMVWRAVVMWHENRLLSLTLFYLSTVSFVCIALVNGLRDIQLGSFLSLTALTHFGVLGVLVMYYAPLSYFIVTDWIHKKRPKENAFETNYRVFTDDTTVPDSLDEL